MRHHRRCLFFSDAIVSLGVLVLLTPVLDQRNAHPVGDHRGPAAGRFCGAAQDGESQRACLAREAEGDPSVPLRLKALKGQAPWDGSTGLAVSRRLGKGVAQASLGGLTSWESSSAQPLGTDRGNRPSFGDFQLAVDPSPQSPVERKVESGLAIGFGSLGLLTAVIAGLNCWQNRKEQRLINSFRRDVHTSLLSGFALAYDLECSPRFHPAGHAEKAMLVTISLRFLERQLAFLSEKEIALVITNACEAIRQTAPAYSTLDMYRTGETKVTLIMRASLTENRHLDKEACESALSDLLAKVSHSVQKSSQQAMDWDDVVITGQQFDLGAPPSSLLSMQAVGEKLASEDRRAFRLIENGDDSLVLARSQVKAQLVHLQSEDLELLFQPILLVANPGQFGLEVLVRFRPEALKNLGTGKVLALAHDIGIAHHIDTLVISRLEEVQQSLRQCEVLKRRIDYVSLNISSDSVCCEDRLNHLISHLKKHRVDSSTFCLEITETAATDIPTGSISVTTASERLTKELNFRIFIDDFGSGLSNYRRICEAWYDAIKLDTNLVKGIHHSFRLQRYIGSFINTVHALGKTVVCEGIETYNEMTSAVRLGADALQGYLISKPLDLEEVTTFLQTSAWASPEALQKVLTKIHASVRLLDTESSEHKRTNMPLERYILANWSRLRSFEEFVLLFVNELKIWGLDILRFSLAFLPDQDDIDCSQYIWQSSTPGKVTTLRFEREFLQQKEHLESPLHYIATACRIFRQKPLETKETGFDFLEELKQEGCSDYLGFRLESRGVSIPVLTIALHGGSSFSDEQIQRIEAMSSLLSLLFYAFESERSKRLALLDSLTMLANRRSFDSFLKSNIANSRLTNSHLALAVIDIDQFKTINDVMGHGYGDHCLKEMALLLNAGIHRKSDFVARLGGEEFAIILPNTDTESALNLCERLRESIVKKCIYHPDPLKGNCLTVSIGIAVWEPDSETICDFDRLQQVADDCLYEAKRSGRNRVICRSMACHPGVAALSSPAGVSDRTTGAP